jgi:hypothetical protein
MIDDKIRSRADPPAGTGPEHAVTPRAVGIGSILVLLLSLVSYYVVIVRAAAYDFNAGVPAPAPFSMLFILCGLVSLPAIGRALRLRRGEMLTIYAMLMAGGPLVSWGTLGWMLPHSVIQHYMGRAMPDWETTFVHLIPRWFAPTDPAAVEGFFLGQTAAPWALWWKPLAAWTSFLVALLTAEWCLLTLLQQQWIQHERLSFPLAQIPLYVAQESQREKGMAAGLPTAAVFWVGVLASFGLGLIRNVSAWVPSLPVIPDSVVLLGYQAVGPRAGLGEVTLSLIPWLAAIAYLIPKELSFSCWFFWWTRVGLTVAAIAAGAEPMPPEEWFGSSFPAPAWQGVGALLALAAWTAWVARRHLGHALRTAVRWAPASCDTAQPLPYRVAVIGFVLAFAWLVGFCWLAGCRAGVAVVFVAVIVFYHLVWARFRAETGLGMVSYPLWADNAMIDIVGSRTYRAQEIVAILSARWSYYSGSGRGMEIFSGNAIESLKVADTAGIHRRRLSIAMTAAFVAALAFGTYIMIAGIYHHGFYGEMRIGTATRPWLTEQLRMDGARIFNYLSQPTQPDMNALVGAVSGAVAAIVLGILRLRFWWFPFHPVGYLAANTYALSYLWSSFFIGWLAKSLVTRYGGLRLYRSTVPLAVGLVAGDLLNVTLWGCINAVVQGTG